MLPQRAAFRLLTRLLIAVLAVSLVGVAPIAPASAATPSTTELPIGEIVERRTANSKTVRRSDGKLTTTVYSGPVHFKSGRGWNPIDSSVVEERKDGFAFKSAANAFGVRFKDTVTADAVSFEVDGSSYAMTLDGAAKAKARVEGARVSYADVAPGVDLVYDVEAEGVKETLVLAAPTSPRAFSFQLRGPPGAVLAAHPADGGAVDVWVDGRRGAVFQLAAPVATEATPEGDPIPGEAPNASMAVTAVDGGLRVDLAVDDAWASDPGRRYPILLDPTLTIQPSAEDASFQGTCPTCVATTGTNLYMGTNPTQSWRSALKFDLSAVPAGAVVSDAKVRLYHGTTCIPSSPAFCGGISHTFNAHRITAAWTTASTGAQVTYDAATAGSFILCGGGCTNTWMSWTLTQTVTDWLAGTTNNGILIKRSDETLNKGGPAPAGKRYTADTTLRPKLEVTYTSDAVDLADPDTTHANGAELHWTKFVSQGGSVFTKYEVHRAAGTAAFTPTPTTLLTTITDPSVTSYTDTTAKPSADFTYRIVTNTAPSNPRTVSLPAAGQSKKVLQPLPADAKQTDVSFFSSSTSCSNYGTDYRMFVGPGGGSLSRAFLGFDLRGVPATATINSATMSLWHPTNVSSSMTVRAHRVTRDWDEGTGASTCSGDGATWYDAQSGGKWATNGGDFDPTALATVAKTAGDTPRWDAFNLTGQVQSWVNGTNPNLGVMLKADDETVSTSRYLYYYSDDVASSPTLRPKLEVLYTDGTQTQGPVATVGGVAAGATVTGTANLSVDASDDRRVDNVEFLVDGVVKGSDATAPYTYAWVSTTATNAAHTITARATDDVGNQTTSPGVAVTVDNTPVPTAAVVAPTGTPYVTAVQADAPRAWWRLGEASGTVANDSTTSARHGTYRSSLPNQPGALANDNNTAARFPATAENVDVSVPDNNLLDFGTGDFTVEAWVKTTLNGEKAIVAKSNNVNANWLLTVTDDAGQVGNVRAVLFDGTTTRTAYGPPIRVDDGNWHHVVAVYQRSYGTRVFVDTVEKATAGTAPNSVSNAATLNIGDTTGYTPFNGDIDDVAIYPTALSAARVLAHYDAAVIKGTTTITATATDDQGVALVEFFVDGNRLADDNVSPYTATWNTTDATNPTFDGDREITTKTYSTGGQITTSAIARKKVGNVAASKYRATLAPTAIPPTVTYDPALGTQDKTGVDVTVTNTSGNVWSATDVVLRSRWVAPDGTTLTDGPSTALGSALATGASATVRMLVDPPALGDGVDQAVYRLRFDLYETSTASWFATKGNAPFENPVTVKKAGKVGLGLERYYHYEGEELGAGMQHLTNVASGNSLWRWTPFSSPGRGLATVVDLTYNSLEDKSDSPAGNNVSLSISGLTRLGSQLDVHPNNADTIAGRGTNRWIAFTDGDGTSHRFEGKQAGDGSVYWEEPAGVHLYLREYSTTDTTKKWALTRPDRVTFFYDNQGYPTGVEDADGNRLHYTLTAVDAGDDPGAPKMRVTAVTDAAGLGGSPAANRTFNITYYTKADAKKPQIRGKVKRITDHDGSALDFEYYEDGNLLRLTQRGGTSADGQTAADRAFVFTYTTSPGDAAAIPLAANRVNPDPKTPSQSTRLYSVRDPRGKETLFTYMGSGSGTQRWRLASRADRKTAATTYAYDLTTKLTTITAPLSRVSTYGWDTAGRVTAITNPKNEVTGVEWTTDNHVQKVTEPTTKFTEYAYNANGYLTDTWDQLRNRTTLDYTNIAIDGNDVTGEWKTGRSIPHVSHLAKKTEPKGTATATPTDDYQWAFTYDAEGHLLTATDPEGFVTATAYNADGTTSTTTDARGVATASPTNDFQTTFNAYDANGLVARVTNAAGNATTFTYTADGLLATVQDARHQGFSGTAIEEYRSRFYYDPFHRLTRQSTPKSTSTDRGNLVWTGASYDANDNVTLDVAPHYGTQWTGTGARTVTSYDDMDLSTLSTGPDTSGDPLGERAEVVYDIAGRVVRQTEPKGVASAIPNDFVTVVDYDALDRPVKRTRYEVDVVGTVTKSYFSHACYDSAGDLRSITEPRANLATVDCNSTTTPFTTRTTYDGAHRPISNADAGGHVSAQTYDANGNVDTTTDAGNSVVTMTYDKRDKVVTIVEPFTTAPARNLTTKVEYDAVGNQKRLISPRAWDASTDKVNFTDYVTTNNYDALNQLTRVDLPKAGTETQLYTHSSYDESGNLTTSTLPDEASDVSLVGATQKTFVEHFDTGWIRTSDEPANPKAHFDYTAEGWQASRTPEDPAGLLALGERQRWQYYADGLVKERQDDADQAQKATYTYDANNNLTSATDAAGVVAATQTPIDVTAAYDGLNRILKTRQKKKAEANYKFTTYGYDLNSNVLDREDDGEETAAGTLVTAGRKHHFDYDASDWLNADFDYGTNAAASDDQRILNLFGPTGKETERKIEANNGAGVWELRQKTTWDHYVNEKLKTMTTTNGVGAVVEAHTLTYVDPLGRYLNGNRTADTFTLLGPDTAAECRSSTCTNTFAFNAREKLTKQELKNGGGTVLNSTVYTLDNAGNNGQEVSVQGGTTTTRTMAYLGNQMSQVTEAGVTQNYVYDSDGNLDCVTSSTGTATDCNTATGLAVSPKLLADYGYDYLNRLGSYRSFTTDGTTSTKDDAADYTYDAFDRTIEETESHGVASPKTTLFSYLGLGTEQSQEQHKDSTGAVTATKSLSYDAFGKRMSMTTTPAGQAAATDTFGYDVHGNVSVLLTSTGTARAAYGYKPYGDTDSDLTKGDVDADNPTNPFRYSAKRFDSGSGSLDMGARRFGPATGRFLQQDRFQGALDDLSLSVDPLSQNRYSLAGGNPISFVEGDGHLVLADGVGTRSTRPNPNYQGKRASVLNFKIPKRSGAGTVRANFFIMDKETGISFFRGTGDDRGFSSKAGPAESRAYVELNFETGEGIVRANPSCKPGGGCSDALGVTTSRYRTLGPKNKVAIDIDQKTGSVQVRHDFLNSDFPLFSPAISGTLKVTPKGSGRANVQVDRDNYPSLEVYQDQRTQGRVRTRTLLRQRQSGIGPLALVPLVDQTTAGGTPRASQPAYNGGGQQPWMDPSGSAVWYGG